MRGVVGVLFLLACNGGSTGDACATCSALSCEGPCPPDLGTPAFDA